MTYELVPVERAIYTSAMSRVGNASPNSSTISWSRNSRSSLSWLWYFALRAVAAVWIPKSLAISVESCRTTRSAAYYAESVPHLYGRGGNPPSTQSHCRERASEPASSNTEGTERAKVATIINEGDPFDQEAAAIQCEVTALVQKDAKVDWDTVGVLGAGNRMSFAVTPISLSDPGSFADDVIRTIVNELTAV